MGCSVMAPVLALSTRPGMFRFRDMPVTRIVAHHGHRRALSIPEFVTTLATELAYDEAATVWPPTVTASLVAVRGVKFRRDRVPSGAPSVDQHLADRAHVRPAQATEDTLLVDICRSPAEKAPPSAVRPK